MKIKKTKNQFILEAKKIHKNYYDYSKVDYIGCQNKVIIICKKHGEFIQNPTNHLQGQGCKYCYFERIKNGHDNFIKRCKKIHNNKYDYSKSIYTGIRKKMIITCPIHGDFEQTAESHVRGRGCRKCTKYCGENLEEFIIKAEKAHGSRYDYSKVVYKNNRTKVKIICKDHGVFMQIPYEHISGAGCPACANCKKLDNKSFIKKAKKIHKNKYDYSLVDYKKSSVKVNILCNKHGVFKQKPNSHLSGNGCPKCADERGAKLRSLSLSHFISRAKKVHGKLYNYKNVEYVNQYKKIKVFCNIHKEYFFTIPTNHLQGTGCPICNNSKGELFIRSILLENKIEFEEQKKFDNCRYKNKLPFDFYIIKKNILIEYHGKQHYEFVKQFHKTEKNFLRAINRDEIKRKFAKDNNIKLLEIPYYLKNEDIRCILVKELL